uniref:Uncharacterized protein n=1 Tax=Anolis carolinensis TaxID=28377 RepID=A0A803TI12_ANOCA
VGPGPDLDGEEVIRGEGIGVEGVVSHVGVEGAVQRDAGAHSGALGDLQRDQRAGELRRVVVDVQHLDLDVEELEVLGREGDDVELDGAVEVLLAELLAVHLGAHGDLAVVLAHGQQRRAAPLHGSEADRRRVGQAVEHVGHVLREPGDHRAHPLLLVDAVLEGLNSCLSEGGMNFTIDHLD